MNRKERRSKSKKINVLEELVTIMKQYFPQLINKFEGLTDKRNQSYVKYKMKVIFIVRLMGLMCEIKAFKRLAKKIKQEYPRLKIIIGADALYAKKPIIDICKGNKWKYIIRFKEGSIPSLYKEFTAIVKEGNESNKERYEYVTQIDYQEEKINIIKYKDKIKNTEFVYITDLPISNKNIEATINIGRKRWKIENEGFNVQKNGTFDIGHLYSKNSVAIKVHYLMIQIAHIIRQLLEKGSKNIKEMELKINEISHKIKQTLISTITNLMVHNKVQLRFD